MAATFKQQMWLHSITGGGTPSVVDGLMAASQGILIPGALLYLSQSGTWKASDTSDGTGDIYNGVFLGLQDKSGDTAWPITTALSANAGIRVMPITTAHVFAVFCENNGTDSVAAQANVGNDYGITISTTAGEVGLATCDLNSGTNTVMRVENIMSNLEPQRNTTASDPGVALVRFLAANIEEERA